MTVVLMKAVDFETSKKEDGEIVEGAYTEVWFDATTRRCEIGQTVSRLFGITRPMDPGAQGTHHITLEEIEGLPPCAPEHLLWLCEGADFLVAHNAAYERGFLTTELLGDVPPAGTGPRWIDTLKCARRAWEEAPEFGLQALRYWRGLRLDPLFALPAHRAGPDSYVGAQMLAELLKTETVNDLVRWTKEPTHYPTCTIGKHRGQRWSDIPHGFLTWMLGADRDFDEDIKAAARNELAERRNRGAST